eukprot:5396210-Amphidinium_carterae.1
MTQNGFSGGLGGGLGVGGLITLNIKASWINKLNLPEYQNTLVSVLDTGAQWWRLWWVVTLLLFFWDSGYAESLTVANNETGQSPPCVRCSERCCAKCSHLHRCTGGVVDACPGHCLTWCALAQPGPPRGTIQTFDCCDARFDGGVEVMGYGLSVVDHASYTTSVRCLKMRNARIHIHGHTDKCGHKTCSPCHHSGIDLHKSLLSFYMKYSLILCARSSRNLCLQMTVGEASVAATLRSYWAAFHLPHMAYNSKELTTKR